MSNFPDPVVLRRLLFAATNIPTTTPRYIELVSNFAFQFSAEKQDIRVLVENLEFLNEKVFCTDKQLMKELVWLGASSKEQLGVILISANSSCNVCGSRLIVRGDRPARVTIYTEDTGTVPGSVYRKYCSKQGMFVYAALWLPSPQLI